MTGIDEGDPHTRRRLLFSGDLGNSGRPLLRDPRGFVGYAARGTPRSIVDGATHVRLFGEEIPVQATIHTINGFSAHADQAELLAWHQQIAAPRTFLVHGEEGTMRRFAGQLKGTRVEMPAPHESFELG